MNLFELERLRREGKDVILSGGRCALDVALGMEFDEADKRLDAYFEARRQEQLELEDKHGNSPTVLLGC